MLTAVATVTADAVSVIFVAADDGETEAGAERGLRVLGVGRVHRRLLDEEADCFHCCGVSCVGSG